MKPPKNSDLKQAFEYISEIPSEALKEIHTLFKIVDRPIPDSTDRYWAVTFSQTNVIATLNCSAELICGGTIFKSEIFQHLLVKAIMQTDFLNLMAKEMYLNYIGDAKLFAGVLCFTFYEIPEEIYGAKTTVDDPNFTKAENHIKENYLRNHTGDSKVRYISTKGFVLPYVKDKIIRRHSGVDAYRFASIHARLTSSSTKDKGIDSAENSIGSSSEGSVSAESTLSYTPPSSLGGS